MARWREFGDILKPAPAVGDFLVLGQRVGDQREGAQVLLEGRRERLGGLAAHLAVSVLKPIESRFERYLLAVDVEAQIGHRLVEETVPGAAPGDRFFMEKLLDAILELVGLVLPQIEHPGPVVTKHRIGVQCLEDQRVVDEVQFEREEQQMRAGVGHFLLDVAVELGALRVRRVAGIDETGIGSDAADQFLQRLEVAQGFAKPTGFAPFGFRRERALPAAFERCGVARRLVQISLQFGRVDAGIEVGQIPFRQIAKCRRALSGRRCAGFLLREYPHRACLPIFRNSRSPDLYQALKTSFTGFFETLFRTLCQDDPDANDGGQGLFPNISWQFPSS